MKEAIGGKHFYGAASVGERGQIVIPKEARDDLCISPGDKLIVLRKGNGGLMLMKADKLREFARKILGNI